MILGDYGVAREIHDLCMGMARGDLKGVVDLNVANSLVQMASTEMFFFESREGSHLASELLDRAEEICLTYPDGVRTEVNI